MIYLTILSITILFFLFAFIISPLSKQLTGIKLCAICAASSTTWLALLTLRTLNFLEVDGTLLGVLFGGSVVGIMYALRDKFKERKIKHFWMIRVLWVPWGFFLAYAVAKKDSSMIQIGLAITFMIGLTILAMFKFKKNENKEKVISAGNKKKTKPNTSDSEKQDAIKKLEENLEDCC
ncbi:MAG: hypothetical protein ABIE03_01965 [Patescibacteria group bacterium]|nr:hypothetical protein [Patescibacteria group bacterium]